MAQYREVFRSPPHVCVYNIIDDTASRSRMAERVDDPWFMDKTVPVVLAAGTLTLERLFGPDPCDQ